MLGILEQYVSLFTPGGCAALSSFMVVLVVSILSRKTTSTWLRVTLWVACALPALLGVWGAYTSLAESHRITSLMDIGGAAQEQIEVFRQGGVEGARKSLVIGVLATCGLLAWLRRTHRTTSH